MDRTALLSVRTIVTHAECSDGTASAILLHDALPQAELVFIDYGAAADRLPATPNMLFCDFSPPAGRAGEFVAANAIVLDHHRTAHDVVTQFGDRAVFGDEQADPGVSGAVLAFRHVWLPLRADSPERKFAEWFAIAAGARDTWQTASSAWHDGCVQHAVLMSLPQAFWGTSPLSVLAREWSERYAPMGELLLQRWHDRLDEAISTAHRFTTPGGIRGIAINGLGYASDLAEQLNTQIDILVAFDVVEETGIARLRLSLRSHTGFDCAMFAQRYGGGGYTRAAGCAIPLRVGDPHPFQLIESLLIDATTRSG